MKAYHFHVDGFSGIVDSLPALTARIAELKGRYPDLIGKPCQIMAGTRFSDGSGFYFPGGDANRVTRTISA